MTTSSLQIASALDRPHKKVLAALRKMGIQQDGKEYFVSPDVLTAFIMGLKDPANKLKVLQLIPAEPSSEPEPVGTAVFRQTTCTFIHPDALVTAAGKNTLSRSRLDPTAIGEFARAELYDGRPVIIQEPGMSTRYVIRADALPFLAALLRLSNRDGIRTLLADPSQHLTAQEVLERAEDRAHIQQQLDRL